MADSMDINAGEDRVPRRWLAKPWVQALLFGVGYLVAAEVGCILSVQPQGFTTFWPVSGVFVAVLLLTPGRTWPLMFLAALLANVTYDLAHGRPLWVSLMFTVGNCGEALTGAWLVRRFVGASPIFSELREVALFTVLSPVLSTMVSATIGTTAVAAAFGTPSYWQTWRLWWSGDFIGIIVAAPLLLIWLPALSRRPFFPSAERLYEAAGVLLAVTALSLAIFSGWPGWPVFSRAFVIMPFLVWSALRFGPRGASLAIALTSAAALAFSARGLGPYAIDVVDAVDDIALLQAMLGNYAIACLLGAALMKQRETALDAAVSAQRRLDLILETSSDVIFMVDTEERLQFVNAEGARRLGLDRKAMIGKHQSAFFSAGSAHTHSRLIQAALDAGKPRVTLNRYHPPGKDDVWLETRLGTVKDARGRVLGVMGVMRDQTEQRRAQAALRDSERLYRSLVDELPLFLFRKDVDGRVTFASTRYCEALELPLERVLGKTDFDLFPAELAEKYRGDDRRVIETGETFRAIEAYRTPGGAEKTVQVIKSPLRDEQDRIVGVQGIFWDVTTETQALRALRDSEERFRLVAERTNDLIYERDIATGLATFFGDMDAFQGYPPGGFPRGLNQWLEHVHPDDLAGVMQAAQHLAEGGESFEAEYRLRRADGSYAHWKDSSMLVHGADGAPFKLVGAATNVTEHKQAAASLRTNREQQELLQEQLVQSQKLESVGRLAGGVAHDFNNLLAIILGYCEILLSESPAGFARRSELEEIAAAGERARNLTMQLLAFSRRQVLDMKPIDLNEAIQGVIKMLRRLIGEDIDVRTTLDHSIGLIKADRTQIEQILLNLSVNARDAMPQGGRLTIATEPETLDEAAAAWHGLRPGPCVSMTVSDTGCGMDEETLRHIFEPFFTTKEKGTGTGLGLATVFGIVKQHGGDISASSEPGRGTKFRILFPEIQDASADSAREEERVIPGRGETVLVMEDDNVLRQMVLTIVSSLGYTVIEAATLDECIKRMWSGQRVDLLLSDVVMPGANGREVYEQLSALQPGLKALFMSGYTDDVITRHGILDAGVNFLAKPFTKGALSRKIREVLDK